jgi:hypothetical protein
VGSRPSTHFSFSHFAEQESCAYDFFKRTLKDVYDGCIRRLGHRRCK